MVSRVKAILRRADNFLLYPRGDTDWLAIEDGTRDIPDLLSDPNVAIPSEARARIEARRGDVQNAQFLDAVSKSFNSVMAPSSQGSPVNQSFSFSVGNQRSIFGRPLGYIAGVTYNRSLSFYDADDNGFTGRYSVSDINADVLNPQLLLTDSQGKTKSPGEVSSISTTSSRHTTKLPSTLYIRAVLSLWAAFS